MPEGPVFYNNDSRLGSDDGSLSNFVTLGDGLIKVYKDTGADRVLAVSFVEEAIVQNIDQDYNLARIGGIPLSVSVCSDESLNPSGVGIGIFHALDVIIYSRAVDLIDNNTVVAKPVVNGVELGVAKVDDVYYLKTYQVSTTPNPTGLIHFGGVPMSYGSENELLIRDSGYTVSDIDPDRYEELKFFGVPIRVGYVDVENKYYLIVDPFVVLTNNIVAQYKMNDNLATTNVINEFGIDGVNFANTDTKDTTGKINGALNFNGFNDFIDTNLTFQSTFSDSYSINFWFKTDNVAPGPAPDRMAGAIDVGGNKVEIFVFASNLIAEYKAGAAATSSASIAHNFNIDQWYMVTITFRQDPGSMQTIIYLDGSNLITFDKAGIDMSFFTMTRDLYIGANDNGAASDHIEGKIDNFCIFNKTLTQRDIDFLYNDGNGTEELSN